MTKVAFISSVDPISKKVSKDLHIGYDPEILPRYIQAHTVFEVDNLYLHM